MNAIVVVLRTALNRVILEKTGNSCSDSQIRGLVWSPEVHYRVHKRPALDFVLGLPCGPVSALHPEDGSSRFIRNSKFEIFIDTACSEMAR
jgi:hypothetical protein